MGKQTVKHQRLNLHSSATVTRISTTALLVGLMVQSMAVAHKPLPPSPPPCAPDGVCHPKVDSWGHHKTRWRAWPGEEPDVVPTPVDEVDPDEELPLPRFHRPDPRDEDLRGPRRAAPILRGAPVDPAAPLDPAAPFDPAAPALPGVDGERALPFGDPFGEEPAQQFQPQQQPQPDFGPGRDDLLPDFNQQGQQLPPATDDAPPQLPSGLQQAMRVQFHHPVPTPDVQAPPQLPAALATAAAQNRTSVAARSETSALRLVNPAAANIVVAEDAEDHLQQALYIEASDQD